MKSGYVHQNLSRKKVFRMYPRYMNVLASNLYRCIRGYIASCQSVYFMDVRKQGHTVPGSAYIFYSLDILVYRHTMGVEMFGLGDFWLETTVVITILTHSS
jgi:hypothetical protein